MHDWKYVLKNKPFCFSITFSRHIKAFKKSKHVLSNKTSQNELCQMIILIPKSKKQKKN